MATPGQRMRASREGAGFTNRAGFARKLGVSESTVRRVEDDERVMRLDTFARFCELVGVSMDWAFRGFECPHPPRKRDDGGRRRKRAG